MKVYANQYSQKIHGLRQGLQGILFYGGDLGLVHHFASLFRRLYSTPPETVVVDPTQDKTWKNALVPQMAFDFGGGGSKIIRILNAGNTLTKDLEAYFKSPLKDTVLILEGTSNITKSSSLLKLFENHSSTLAVPCYPDDADIKSMIIREALEDAKIKASPPLLKHALDVLSGDVGVLKQQMIKVGLYTQGTDLTQLALDDAVQDPEGIGFDILISHIGNKNTKGLLEALELSLESGLEPIALLRMGANHFGRLLQVKSEIQGGKPMESAFMSLRPPIFYKKKDEFIRQVQSYSLREIQSILKTLIEAEIEFKTTTPISPNVLISRLLLGLSLK